MIRKIKSVSLVLPVRMMSIAAVLVLIVSFCSAQIAKQENARSVLKKVERKNIPYFVKITQKAINPHELKLILKYNPTADLEKYPLYEYIVNKERISPLKIGRKVPNEILDLPIRIINDKKGRGSITLRELSKDKILVLDFWATWCSPCLESMDKWKELQPKYSKQIEVVGLMLDYDFKAEVTVAKKGWNMPQLVGPEVYLLNYYFCGMPITGPSAWINKGKFIGVTETKADSEKIINSLLNGEVTIIPDDGFKLEVSKIK